MVVGESGATGSDCSVESRTETPDDVCITFTDNDFVFGDNLFFCPVKAVQHFAFVIETGLGGVFVFGLLTLWQHSTAESDHNSVGVRYWKHHAISEEVDG